MFAEWAFWMMKMTTTMREATPAISAERIPLITRPGHHHRGVNPPAPRAPGNQ